MPNLNILIWFNFCISTAILFWIVYYIVLRFLIKGYFFIFDIRIKLRNLFFVLSYVLFSLVVFSLVIFFLVIFYILCSIYSSTFFCNLIAEASMLNGEFSPGEIIRTQKDLDLLKVYKHFIELLSIEDKRIFFSQVYLHMQDTCGNSLFCCGNPGPRTLFSGDNNLTNTPPTYNLNATVRAEFLAACYKNLSVFNNSLKTDVQGTVNILNSLWTENFCNGKYNIDLRVLRLLTLKHLDSERVQPYLSYLLYRVNTTDIEITNTLLHLLCIYFIDVLGLSIKHEDIPGYDQHDSFMQLWHFLRNLVAGLSKEQLMAIRVMDNHFYWCGHKSYEDFFRNHNKYYKYLLSQKKHQIFLWSDANGFTQEQMLSFLYKSFEKSFFCWRLEHQQQTAILGFRPLLEMMNVIIKQNSMQPFFILRTAFLGNVIPLPEYSTYKCVHISNFLYNQAYNSYLAHLNMSYVLEDILASIYQVDGYTYHEWTDDRISELNLLDSGRKLYFKKNE